MEMELNFSATSIYRILTEHLGLRKVCSRFVPHKLSDAEKALRIQHSKDIIEKAKKDRKFLYSIVTGDETWCFEYDPGTKRQSAEWKAPDEPKTKKIAHGKIKNQNIAHHFLRLHSLMRNSFHLAKRLMLCIILVLWSVYSPLFVVCGQNIVKVEAGVCCMIMRRLIDRHWWPIFFNQKPHSNP